MKRLYIIVCMLFVATFLGGCGDKKEVSQLFADMNAALGQKQSVEAEIDMLLDMVESDERESVHSGVDSEIEVKAEKESGITSLKATSKVPEYPGDPTVSEAISAYQDGKVTAYEKGSNRWYRSVTEAEGSMYESVLKVVTDLENYAGSLHLVDSDGKILDRENICMEGHISVDGAKELLKIVDMDSELEKEKIVVKLWIDSETKLPLKVSFDLTTPLMEAYEKQNAADKFETDWSVTFKISVLYKGFDTVSGLSIPDETTETIEDVEEEKETTVEEWKAYVLGEAEKFDVELETAFDLAEEEYNSYTAKEWEELLYRIYKEAGLYGEE